MPQLNDFEIALSGIESYCCLDMTHVKDNTVNEFAHARKITHLVCPTLYIVQLNLVLTYFQMLMGFGWSWIQRILSLAEDICS